MALVDWGILDGLTNHLVFLSKVIVLIRRIRKGNVVDHQFRNSEGKRGSAEPLIMNVIKKK